MPPNQTESLQLLQAELLHLKRQVPGLQLRRSTAAESPTHPFPITARAEIVAPPDAERFDVTSFTLLVRLNSPPLTLLADALPGIEQQQPGAAVEVEVCSEELPASLREAMAEKLHSLWAALSPGAEGGHSHLNLALLWSEARRQYASLLSLMPQLLESYQTEDASGSTARRWAVLNDSISVTIDTAPHPAAPAAAPATQPPAASPARAINLQRPAAAAAQAGARSGRLSRPAAVPAAKQVVQAAGGAESGSGGLPRGLQAELEFLKKRHGLRLVPLQHVGKTNPDPFLNRLAAPSAAGNAAVSQLAGLALADKPAAAGPAKPADTEGAQATGGGGSGDGNLVAAFQLELQPTDPAWPAQHPLLLHGWAAAAYPQPGCLCLEVSEEQQPPLALLHRQVLHKLVASEVAAAAGRPGALRSVLRYLENHAGQLWQQAEDIAAEVARRRRQQEEAQERQLGQPVGEHLGYDSDSDSDSTGSSDGHSGSSISSADGSESNGSDSAREEGGGMTGRRAGANGGGGGGGHSDAVLPLVLQLDELNLVDVDALELLRLNLQVSCQRCRAAGELSFASAAVALPSEPSRGGGRGGSKGRASGLLTAAAECPTCHAEWAVEVAPKLVHERSNVMAHLRAEGCSPADLLPSMLAAQCSHCASSAAFRSVAVGPWNERTCSSCHTPMRFQFSSAIFAPHRQAGSGQQRSGAGAQQAGGEQRRAGGGGGAAATAAAFQGLLQVGQPLPDRGTCEHYRHSYRWLRFPCCGRRFPCDLCHEELTDGHDMQWARRMVCGLCSVEQSVAPECKACGKKLATSASAPTGRRTRFWEGGKGQRDPTKLHKDDPRRHRSKFKTRSGKSKRVGAEGKARREREQQQQ